MNEGGGNNDTKRDSHRRGKRGTAVKDHDYLNVRKAVHPTSLVPAQRWFLLTMPNNGRK